MVLHYVITSMARKGYFGLIDTWDSWANDLEATQAYWFQTSKDLLNK